MSIGRSEIMKRGFLVVALVAAIASSASAAGINFFVSVGSNVADGQSALANGLATGQNASVPTASPNVTIALWGAVNSNSPAGALGFTGGAFDVAETGGQTWAANLLLSNPPWNGGGNPGLAGGPGYTHQGFSFNSAGPGGSYPNQGSGPAPAFSAGGYNVYLLGTGSFNGTNPGGLWLELPFFQAIGDTSSTGVANGVAFGFAADPQAGNWDVFATADDGSGPVPAPGSGDVGGFIGDGSVGAIRSRVADLDIVPEPATLALLGLGVAFLRRRK